jgi:lysophospholipase
MLSGRGDFSLKSLLLTAFFVLLPNISFGISEQNFDQVFDERVVEFYKHAKIEKMGDYDETHTLKYLSLRVENEKAAIVIVPGRTQALIQYKELIYDLGTQGYSIYILDHRGQGYSDRLIENREIGYVDHFENYVKDLSKFIQTVVKKEKHPKLFMLAHSMGGTIGALYLESHHDFDAAVLSSPMLEINTGDHSKSGVRALMFEQLLTGGMTSFAPGETWNDPQSKFQDNKTVGSEVRFNRMKQATQQEQYTTVGGASYQWVNVAILAGEEAIRKASKIQTPTLVFQAGNDNLVREGGQNKFVARCPSGLCSMIRFNNARHDLLRERDTIRDIALGTILKFFANHL